ncbi:MAG: HyaD/HybD family hydrogenase maturation endopeptidase [Motiliproteus sp.]|nr:HyaD/HybD family hydrogenase maturation endopeptidase [Motiliproteus sp.]MCW9051756.1 HyaD/HybD family hydrogenase maturation endopeptidase [Motiliproteus sp.]
MKEDQKQVLILGIGNVLWADEGFGVRAVEYLHRHYQFSDNVKLMDGGTQGIYLVQHVQEVDVLVVFDAVDYGLEPGTMKRVEGDEVPKFMGAKKMSLHQTGFQEVLAMAEFTGSYPEHLLLMGVQPVELEDFGGSLRPAVKDQIQPAIQQALSYLQNLGVKAVHRNEPLAETDLAPGELELDRYETDRPSEQQACRVGDPRVLFAQDSVE